MTLNVLQTLGLTKTQNHKIYRDFELGVLFITVIMFEYLESLDLTSALVLFCHRFFKCVQKFKFAYMREKVQWFTFAPHSDLPDDDAHCETLCKKISKSYLHT